MPKSVFIILAAVVVLIAVVVILGMRYLRSDDEEFDDFAGTGASPDQHVPAARRRGHNEFDAQRDLPRPVARSAAGRDSREAGERREARGRGDFRGDDRTELLPAGGRASRTQPGSIRAAGADAPAGRSRGSAPDFDRGGRDRDGAARRDARTRGPVAGSGDARDSDIRDRRDGRAARSAPAVRELAVTRDQPEDLLPPVKPRQSKGKSKRDGDVDWPTNEWDELSDVDYWTELASDKPFTADAPAAARPSRSDRGSDRTAREREADRAARGLGEDLTSTGPRPVTSGRTERPAAQRAETLRPEAQRPEILRSDSQRMEPPRSRHAAALDDDPLTSPSFPRIDANDSRSYRRSRSGSHERPAAGSEYAAAPTSSDQPAGAYARPAANGYRDALTSQELPVPDSYLMPAWNGAGRHGASASGPGYGYDTGQNGASQYGTSQHRAGQYGAGQYGTDLNGASHYEPAHYGAASAGYGSSSYDRASGYGASSGYDFGGAGYGSDPLGSDPLGSDPLGSDPLGYGGYGSHGHSGGYDNLGSGYVRAPQPDPGYPASPAESAYPYQPGGPESYPPSVAPTAPYLYEPPSAQPGNPGDYAGADPYAVDPYGYGNTSY